MINNETRRPVRLAVLLLAAVLLLFGATPAAWAAGSLDSLMPMAGGALVHAGQQDWSQAGRELGQFEAEWKALQPPSSALADNIVAAIVDAKKAMKEAQTKPDAAYQAFSKLAKATDAFVSAQTDSGGAKGDGKAAAKMLLPVLQQTLDAIKGNDLAKARSEFKRFDSQWKKAESLIRSDSPDGYGKIETDQSLARIALQAEPSKPDNAAAGITALMKTIDDYANGKLQQRGGGEGKHTIQEAVQLLQNVQHSIQGGQPAAAADQLQSFILLWPSIEGVVLTRAPELYTKIENQMTEAAGRLLSSPPKTQEASTVIASMIADLEPFQDTSGYTAWDTALILLREGGEAILILAALLAFLKRTGNASKQKWVWSGVASGLLLSAILTVVLAYTITSLAAGSTREMLEGFTGLASVVMMLTVGTWLHSKSQTAAWSSYIKNQFGVALTEGNLWSLFVVAGLAVLREGAETAIFYIGMAPSTDPKQLMTGIGVSLIVLAILGFSVVKGSVRLPVRPFFLTATALIYYFMFKFLGHSIHSLQVSQVLSAHHSTLLPGWSWLGMYPTWESTVPQIVALLFIVWLMIRTERKKPVQAEAA